MGRRFAVLGIAGSVICGALPVFAAEPPGGYVENPAWGFKVKVPRDWKAVAIASKEAWIAAKHLGKRELEAQDRTRWEIETPEMWVVGWVRGQDINPYEDFDGFLQGCDDFLSWNDDCRVLSREEETVDGVPVTKVAVMKGGPKVGERVLAWVYRFDDATIAVAFKILDQHYGNYEPTFRGCLRSFARIERTERIGGDAAVTLDDIAQLPPEKRERALRDAVRDTLARTKDRLPDGWRARDTKRFLVVSNADADFARGIGRHAEAAWDHLDDLFGEARGGFFVPVIVRVFETPEQRDAYGTPNRDALVPELVVAAGHGWVKDSALEALNKGLLEEWMHRRHRALRETLPKWLLEGLDKYMELLRSKGRRIEFSNEDWDRTEMRLQIDQEKYEPLLAVLSRGIFDLGDRNGAMSEWERDRQSGSVVFWLMGEGNRGRYKGLVADFVGHVLDALREAETAALAQARADEAAVQEKKPEEIHPAEVRHRVDLALQGQRAEILQQAYRKSFGDWDDRDWERLTRAWLGYAE